MATFVGRARELAELQVFVDRLTDSRAGDRPGKALLISGHRRVGKSRLIEEFLKRSGVPAVFYTASAQTPERELKLFAEAVASSNLPGADLFRDVTPQTWEAALRLFASAVPEGAPSVLVIDELPNLIATDPSLEGMLQKMFDRVISRRPVLMIGVGSDLSMMEVLNEYGRPFHQRASEMIVPALAPSETALLLGLSAPEALDAHLTTGGLPLIADEWPTGMPMWDYLASALSSSPSALVVSGERMLAAEFPDLTQARVVLTAIGSGETTFANIAQRAGGLHSTALTRALTTLRDKRIVTMDQPLSTSHSKVPRYRVTDPYLRFWLAFIGPALAEIERRGPCARLGSAADSLAVLARPRYRTCPAFRGRAHGRFRSGRNNRCGWGLLDTYEQSGDRLSHRRHSACETTPWGRVDQVA